MHRTNNTGGNYFKYVVNHNLAYDYLAVDL